MKTWSEKITSAWTYKVWEIALDGKKSGVDYEVFKNNLMDKYGYSEKELEDFALRFILEEVYGNKLGER